jgi:hypothetical protein
MTSMKSPSEATDHARAVAAVRKWRAEHERRDRFVRRYSNPNAPKRVDAEARFERATREAAIALLGEPDSTVEVDGTRYRGRVSREHGFEVAMLGEGVK